MKNVLHVGRAKKNAPRKFPESFLFTLGVAFSVVYVVGLLVTSGGEAPVYTEDAVPVFAEQREEVSPRRTVWTALEDCIKDAVGEEK